MVLEVAHLRFSRRWHTCAWCSSIPFLILLVFAWRQHPRDSRGVSAQAAEIQRLRQRVEKQAVLLEDRCQVEMELRAKDKATRDTLQELRAANESLARDNKHMTQVAISFCTLHLPGLVPT